MAAGGNNQSEQYLFAVYLNSLSSPLQTRCAEITAILETASPKELKYLFGRLVEDVFGFRTKQDWGLLTLDNTDRDYNVLKTFLAVEGPVLRSCYKLLEDPHAQFEFHVSCLPASSRQCLEKGNVPPFYSNKIYATVGGTISSSYLLLNSFEFFIFHFAYYIACPTWKGYSSNVNQMDTVYANLLEEYLKYFLPTDGKSAPVLSSPAKTLSPNKTLHSPHQRNTSWNATLSTQGTDQSFCNGNWSPYKQSTYMQQKQRPSILKPGVLELLYSIPDLNSHGVPPLGTSKSETWRSEELLSILSEMYLNQGTTKQVHNVAGFIRERYVPSHYHVYMARVLIKHVHYFANTFVPSMHLLNGSPFALDLLSELKSIVLPRLIQKNLYNFLKLTFDRWPLDDSFRVPLETWLSYIQPWRYTDARTLKEEEEKGFVNRWLKFATENLHFYTPFLSQVLRRFSRMDLCCPKTAYMLFRTTKVFSQGELDTLIQRAEKHFAVAQSTSRSPYAVSPYASSYSNEMGMSTLQESQSPNSPVGCQELFDKNMIIQVSHLVKKIISTKEEAKSMKLSNDNGCEGFFSRVFTFGTDNKNVPAEEYSPPDSKKLIYHLESSVDNLCKVFSVIPPTDSEIPRNFKLQDQSEFSFRKSPVKKMNLPSGNINMDTLILKGNPDLQPVRTYEYDILVKAFNDASAYLNEKYGEKIRELYFRPTLLGRMCQQVLAGPTKYVKITKYKSMKAPKIEEAELPPRIYLRFLAIKHILWYSIMYFLVMYYLGGFHPFPSTIILMFIAFIVLFLRAVFTRGHQRRVG